MDESLVQHQAVWNHLVMRTYTSHRHERFDSATATCGRCCASHSAGDEVPTDYRRYRDDKVSKSPPSKLLEEKMRLTYVCSLKLGLNACARLKSFSVVCVFDAYE